MVFDLQEESEKSKIFVSEDQTCKLSSILGNYVFTSYLNFEDVLLNVPWIDGNTYLINTLMCSFVTLDNILIRAVII